LCMRRWISPWRGLRCCMWLPRCGISFDFMMVCLAACCPGRNCGDFYRVAGNLTIRDISKPLTTVLKLTPQGDKLQVDGEIKLSRLAFEIGAGEWADTQWVGDQVTITLANILVPAG